MIFRDPWTSEQQELVDLIYVVWRDARPAGRWPVFSYVEAELYRRQALDAREVLASFPVVGQIGASSQYYADVSYDRRGPAPDSLVRLTVAGLSRAAVDAQNPPGMIFMSVLKCAGEQVLKAQTDPFTVSQILLPSTSLPITSLADANIPLASPEMAIPAMYDLIFTEPFSITGLAQASQKPDGSWEASVAPHARRHASGTTLEDYLRAIVEGLTPPQMQQPRVLPSPLALLEALHYLDITWQRHCSRPLVQVSNPAAAATLAFDAANQDEFAARINALADLLKALQTHSAPRVSGHALQRLGAYLEATLEDPDDKTATASVLLILQNIVHVRNAVHAAAASRGAGALMALGMTYPPTDWNETWLRVRAMATDALMDLRPLVEHLPIGGCTDHPISPR